jgi:hypothetical protein
LFLLANNLDTFRFQVVLVPCAVSVAIALVLWAATASVLRSARKAAILVSLLCLVFYSFEHVRRLVVGLGAPAGAAGVAVGGVALLLLASVLIRLARHDGDLRKATRILNGAVVVMVGISLVRVGIHELRARVPEAQPNTLLSDKRPYAQRALRELPDLYFIVLDGYGRHDVLLERYGYDNGELLRHLESKGFFVADRGRANYAQTALSLAATLNLEYVQTLLPGLRSGHDLAPVKSLIQNNRVFAQLREMGYKLVTLSTASDITDLVHRDVYFDGTTLNEFETGLLSLTPLPLAARLLGEDEEALLDPYEAHRSNVLFKFEKLKHLDELSRPIAVFAHFLSPHPPFVFAADGDRVDPTHPFSTRERDNWEGYVDGYRAQLGFVDRNVREMVDAIFERSPRPPIIVIQGDHGPASAWLDSWRRHHRWNTRDAQVYRERLSVLNAMYLPEDGNALLYDSVSLVNTFRLILNHYFGGRLALLPDENFFSEYGSPYGFSKVTGVMDRVEEAAASE